MKLVILCCQTSSDLRRSVSEFSRWTVLYLVVYHSPLGAPWSWAICPGLQRLTLLACTGENPPSGFGARLTELASQYKPSYLVCCWRIRCKSTKATIDSLMTWVLAVHFLTISFDEAGLMCQITASLIFRHGVVFWEWGCLGLQFPLRNFITFLQARQAD